MGESGRQLQQAAGTVSGLGLGSASCLMAWGQTKPDAGHPVIAKSQVLEDGAVG